MVLTWDIVRRIIEVLWLVNDGFAIWTVFRSRRDIASTWAWLLVFIYSAIHWLYCVPISLLRT